MCQGKKEGRLRFLFVYSEITIGRIKKNNEGNDTREVGTKGRGGKGEEGKKGRGEEDKEIKRTVVCLL